MPAIEAQGKKIIADVRRRWKFIDRPFQTVDATIIPQEQSADALKHDHNPVIERAATPDPWFALTTNSVTCQ
jgi:hypothetical protein